MSTIGSMGKVAAITGVATLGLANLDSVTKALNLAPDSTFANVASAISGFFEKGGNWIAETTGIGKETLGAKGLMTAAMALLGAGVGAVTAPSEKPGPGNLPYPKPDEELGI